jgi:hypothetical protein
MTYQEERSEITRLIKANEELIEATQRQINALQKKRIVLDRIISGGISKTQILKSEPLRVNS